MTPASRHAVTVAVFGTAIGVVFCLDPLGIRDPVLRSLAAGLLGAATLAAAERGAGGRGNAPVGRLMFFIVICVVFFGDPIDVANPFARCILAVALAFGAALVAEMAAGAFGLRRSSQVLLATAALAAAGAQAQGCADPAPDPEAAWSAGYAMYVGRFCSSWRADLRAMDDRRALPGSDPACFDEQFAPGSPAAEAFRSGGAAAEAAHAADPSFCADPTRSPPARPQVGAFVARRP